MPKKILRQGSESDRPHIISPLQISRRGSQDDLNNLQFNQGGQSSAANSPIKIPVSARAHHS